MNPKPPLRSFSYSHAVKPKPVPPVRGGPVNRTAKPVGTANPTPAIVPVKPAAETREPALFDTPTIDPATPETAFPLSKESLDSLFQAPSAENATNDTAAVGGATPAGVAGETAGAATTPVGNVPKAPREAAATDLTELASTTAATEPTANENTPAEPAHRPPVLTMHFQVIGTEHTPETNAPTGEPPAIPATKPAKRATTPAAVASRPKSAPRLSALDAAAKVLAAGAEPLSCPELIDAMMARKLWASENGKTPAATLHSAIMREINTKGAASRFEKVGRGKFARRPMM